MKANGKRDVHKEEKKKKNKHFWHFDLLADKKVNELIWYCMKQHNHTQWQINGKLFTQLLKIAWCRWTCTKYPAKCTIIYLYAYEQWQNFQTTNDMEKDKRMRNGILLMIFAVNSIVSIYVVKKNKIWAENDSRNYRRIIAVLFFFFLLFAIHIFSHRMGHSV